MLYHLEEPKMVKHHLGVRKDFSKKNVKKKKGKTKCVKKKYLEIICPPPQKLGF